MNEIVLKCRATLACVYANEHVCIFNKLHNYVALHYIRRCVIPSKMAENKSQLLTHLVLHIAFKETALTKEIVAATM